MNKHLLAKTTDVLVRLYINTRVEERTIWYQRLEKIAEDSKLFPFGVPHPALAALRDILKEMEKKGVDKPQKCSGWCGCCYDDPCKPNAPCTRIKPSIEHHIECPVFHDPANGFCECEKYPPLAPTNATQ